MKKTFITALTLGVALSGISVFAETASSADVMVTVPTAPSVSVVASVTERQETILSNTLSRIKARGAELIKQRIAALTSTGEVFSRSKTLTTDQKASLATIINTNITNLTALGVSIQAGTDATTTKPLVASIFTVYRIYGVVIPQVHLEKRVYDLQNYTTKLADTFIKIQAKITAAKTNGKDVTAWQKGLDEAKALVAKDMVTLSSTLAKVSALKPSDYGTTSKVVIEQANVDIKSISKDFNTITKKVRRPDVLKKIKVETTISATGTMMDH